MTKFTTYTVSFICSYYTIEKHVGILETTMTFSCKCLWTIKPTAAPSQYVFSMLNAFILVMILFLFWYNWGTAWLPFITASLFTITVLPFGSFKNEKLPPTYFAIWFLFFLSQIMVLQSSATYVLLIIFTSPNNQLWRKSICSFFM